MTTNDGGPAFPHEYKYGDGTAHRSDGMTLREYAAIKLMVPESGVDWLDDMIRAAHRDRFAGMALQGLCAHPDFGGMPNEQLAALVYEQADAMLAARGKS